MMKKNRTSGGGGEKDETIALTTNATTAPICSAGTPLVANLVDWPGFSDLFKAKVYGEGDMKGS